MFFMSNCQWSSIGSDNGLAPGRRQAIIWTNGGSVYWHIYAPLGLNELTDVQKGMHISIVFSIGCEPLTDNTRCLVV